jgi:paraquat-inducible protein A
MALTAIILAIPANLYPQLSFSLLGQANYYTLWGGAQHLLNTGFWWVGLLVITGTVVAPLALLSLILLLCLGWFGKLPNDFFYPLLKTYRHLSSWVMLDVYLLAVIVSVVKLQDMGDFALTRGFYCFVLLLLSLSAALATFNQERFWELLEERDRARH